MFWELNAANLYNGTIRLERTVWALTVTNTMWSGELGIVERALDVTQEYLCLRPRSRIPTPGDVVRSRYRHTLHKIKHNMHSSYNYQLTIFRTEVPYPVLEKDSLRCRSQAYYFLTIGPWFSDFKLSLSIKWDQLITPNS